MSLAIWVIDYVTLSEDGEQRERETLGFHQSLEGALSALVEDFRYGYREDNVAFIVNEADQWDWYIDPQIPDSLFSITQVEVLP